MAAKYTTVALQADTKRRFDEMMPYESMSADEFVSELLDTWEVTGSDE